MSDKVVYVLSLRQQGNNTYTVVRRKDRTKDRYCDTYDLPLETVRNAMLGTGLTPDQIEVE